MEGTVNQPSSQPTNKLTAATLGAALVPALGLILRNAFPNWYDPDVLLGMTPIVVYLLGYLIKDDPNITIIQGESDGLDT